MRADRLLSVLLLLQARGRVTTAEVAEELEVSERTARRDLDALAMSGVPIFSRQGRNGGWELLGGSRTDLTGLTAPEARALFLVAGPAAAASPAVKTAVRKLLQALPEPMRREAESASTAIVVDATAWRTPRPADVSRPPFLDRIEQAVIESEQLELDYSDRTGSTSQRVVHPLGLASKGSTWYLVADTAAGLRTFRVSRVRGAEGNGHPVVRPADFDLQRAWSQVTTAIEGSMQMVWAEAHALPERVAMLRSMFGDRLRLGPKGPAGLQLVEISGPTALILARDIAGLTGILDVISPPEVRHHLAELGAELVRNYRPVAKGKRLTDAKALSDAVGGGGAGDLA